MENITVKLTPTAAVKGKTQFTSENLRSNGVFTFLGIPYASPPIGKLRFQPPEPVQLWKGMKECINFGAICPQNLDASRRFITFDVAPQMNEDCLFLNIYTPTVDKRSKLPVMFWIHGGGFMSGYSNDFEGTSLCNFHDVVVVSINYRLGLFGFSVTGDIIKGNMGVLDQIEALKWVQKYIINFGGDPNNVTIFGESAGGMSSCFHMLSPLAEGLFHKAICESGVNAHFGIAWPKNNAIKHVLKRLGKMGLKNTRNEKDVANFMHSLSTAELIGGLVHSFMPVIDGYYLPDSPVNLYKQGRFNKDVDVIMGFNEHEGSLFVYRMFTSPPNSFGKAKVLLDKMVDVMFLRGVNNSELVKKAIAEEYFQGLREGDEDGYLKAITEIYGDLLFVAPNMFCAAEHAKQGNGRVYVYEFQHRRPNFPYKRPWIGADHLEEIPYVLGKPFQTKYADIKWTKDDREFSKDVMGMWANFATYGNPNGRILKDWPQYSRDNGEYMVLHPNFEVRLNHKPKRMKLWNEDIPSIIAQPKSKY